MNKKGFKYYGIIWAILFVVFNVVTFVTPSEFAGMSKFGGAFWMGYVFITLAFMGQLAVSYFAFKAENIQKLFYKIPLIRISWTGLILTLVFGVLGMVIPDLPYWVGIIACIIVLGFNAIALVKANAAADIVGEIDDKIKVQTKFIKLLTADSEHLMSVSKTDEMKTVTKKVYEAIRYSDPMSDEELSEIENMIKNSFNSFENAVFSEDTELASSVAEELISQIDKRNKKCKVLK